MGVFAGFGATFAAAAELVEGACGAVPDLASPGVQAALAVGAAAVGQAARAVEVVLPVDVDRVVMDDHAGERLDGLGVVGVVARHLKGQPAAAGDLHGVEGHLPQAVQLLGEHRRNFARQGHDGKVLCFNKIGCHR